MIRKSIRRAICFGGSLANLQAHASNIRLGLAGRARVMNLEIYFRAGLDQARRAFRIDVGPAARQKRGDQTSQIGLMAAGEAPLSSCKQPSLMTGASGRMNVSDPS